MAAVLQLLGLGTFQDGPDTMLRLPILQNLMLQNTRITREFWVELEQVMETRRVAGGGSVNIHVDSFLGDVEVDPALERLKAAGLVTVSLREGAFLGTRGFINYPWF
ncbi:hypothetical protein EVG20_g2179 [Dentipellis fragilis]|uniref:Uncharacterized protein n=1 Tax=Dentipellis fragilis TaxID=205917 RepID=A0A4Y9Z8R1_9AGAM|nr:hypothetical protein EVG20_g2179 [Dentipellis fragilis]